MNDQQTERPKLGTAAMTDEQRVCEVFTDAAVWKGWDDCIIASSMLVGSMANTVIGRGATEPEAWADAAKRVEEQRK